MAGHRPWNEIKRKRSPEDQARISAGARAMHVIAALTALRESQGITQSVLASSLGVSQPRVSQIEHHDDITLTSLIEIVRSMGGELRISVAFPDRTVDLLGEGPEAASVPELPRMAPAGRTVTPKKTA